MRKASVAVRGQARKKARECRARGQSLAAEQGHEGLRKRQELLIELLQRAFAADGVAEEHGEKIDDLVVPEAAAGKAHLRADGRKDALLAKIGDDQRYLPEPGRGRGDRLGRGLDIHRDIGDTSHVYLLVGNSFVSSLSRRHIFIPVRYWLHLVAQFVGKGKASRP